MRWRTFAMVGTWLPMSLAAAAAEEVDLVLMYSDLEPYVVAANEGVTGFLGDYLNRAGREAGVRLSWRYIPWDTQVPLLRRNQANLCGVGLFWTPERATFLKFSPPIGQDQHFVLVGRKADARLAGHATLAAVLADSGLRGVVQNNTSYGSRIDAMLRGRSLVAATGSTLRILRDLAGGDAGDYLLAAEDFIGRGGYDGLAIYDHFTDMVNTDPYYLACTRATDDSLLARMNAVIARLGMARGPGE